VENSDDIRGILVIYVNNFEGEYLVKLEFACIHRKDKGSFITLTLFLVQQDVKTSVVSAILAYWISSTVGDAYCPLDFEQPQLFEVPLWNNLMGHKSSEVVWTVDTASRM